MTLLEPRTWKYTILQGPDEEKLRELRAAAAKVDPTGKTDVALMSEDPDEAHRLAVKAANDFAEEAESRGVTIVLRTVGRKTWRTLIAEHPAREGNDEDKAAGFNVETFPEALVPACIGSIGTGDISPGAVADLLDALTQAQFDLLAVAAYNLHTALGANPKERLLSAPAAS